MKKYIPLLYFLVFSIQVFAQKDLRIDKNTDSERYSINHGAYAFTRNIRYGEFFYGFLACKSQVIDNRISRKHYIQVYRKLLMHPFLEDSLRAKIASILFIDRKSNFKKLNRQERYMVAKYVAKRIAKLPTDAYTVVLLRLGYLSKDYPLRFHRPYDALLKLGKYSVPYLYKMLDNKEFLYMHIIGKRRYGFQKRDIAAYIIAVLLKEKYEPLPVDIFTNIQTYDNEKLSQNIDAFIKRISKKRKNRKWLKMPNIKYNDTFFWYYDKDGNPTKNVSEIVER